MKASAQLIKDVKETAYLEGDFTTRAGKKTDYYIDKYLIETVPALLDAITSEVTALFPESCTYDRIAAPELGAVALAAAVSIKLNKPFVIVRKANKGYGTSKLIEGAYNKGERMVMIEDVLTTGGAALAATDVLQAEDVTVTKIVGIINREEGAIENINAKGIEAEALITSTDLKTC